MKNVDEPENDLKYTVKMVLLHLHVCKKYRKLK